jgi:hypothetical protein
LEVVEAHGLPFRETFGTDLSRIEAPTSTAPRAATAGRTVVTAWVKSSRASEASERGRVRWYDGIAANQDSNSVSRRLSGAGRSMQGPEGMNEGATRWWRRGRIVPERGRSMREDPQKRRRGHQVDGSTPGAGEVVPSAGESPGDGWPGVPSGFWLSLRWRFSSALRFLASSRWRFSYE